MTVGANEISGRVSASINHLVSFPQPLLPLKAQIARALEHQQPKESERCLAIFGMSTMGHTIYNLHQTLTHLRRKGSPRCWHSINPGRHI